MKEVFLTIIIPVYNSQKYLKTCLDSIVNQKFNNYEVICVNDGSTDNSLQILQEYADRDGRFVLLNQQNSGQGVARNKALKQSLGKFILYLDSDDWLEDDALEKIYNKLINTPVDILIFNYKKHFLDGSIIEQMYNKPFYELFGETVFTKEQASNVLLSINALSFKVYKRDFLIKNNILHAETKFLEDHIFFIKSFLLADSLCCLNACLGNYRIHHQSTTFNIYKKIKSFEKILYMSFEAFEKYKFSDDKLLEESFLSNRIGGLLYYFNITPFLYKRQFFYSAKRIAKFINDKYDLCFYENNTKAYLFKYILNESYITYIMNRLKVLFSIYMV